MVSQVHALLIPFVLAGCCDNGEGGTGLCHATVEEQRIDGWHVMTSSYGPTGRKMSERLALKTCGLPPNADPSLVKFRDELTYIDTDGTKQQYVIMDIDQHFFKCPEPGKDAQ
ncbi:hypothetical protein GCM10011360_01850 [Primorskyibacter flagellatus]|uniref:Uncharacterized protein n=1 Tax=Primorskyibacter flagellatus TaxID=1387277 RepID=A0A916ZX86_9RHOB|nr:hypothetical protein [Primorskyibacter flagellatus]GGE16711.1 hypothetical protein GCM10011360_01850 [Primorskyibacter flagellatus]